MASARLHIDGNFILVPYQASLISHVFYTCRFMYSCVNATLPCLARSRFLSKSKGYIPNSPESLRADLACGTKDGHRRGIRRPHHLAQISGLTTRKWSFPRRDCDRKPVGRQRSPRGGALSVRGAAGADLALVATSRASRPAGQWIRSTNPGACRESLADRVRRRRIRLYTRHPGCWRATQ